MEHSALGALHGAAEHRLDGILEIGPTFALLAGASPSGRAARHPNKKCRTTDGLVMKAFQSVAAASRLANTTALLLVYLEGMIRDLESKSLTELLPGMTTVVDTVIQDASTQATALGNSLAQLTMARRHIWLSQSGLSDAERAAVMGASVSPSQVFGPAPEAALEEAQKARLRTQSFRQQGLSKAAPQAAPERWSSHQPLGLLHMRPLQYWFLCQKLSLPWDRLARLALSHRRLKVLAWWQSSRAVLEGVPLGLGGSRVP